jgi:hypothetical protein
VGRTFVPEETRSGVDARPYIDRVAPDVHVRDSLGQAEGGCPHIILPPEQQTDPPMFATRFIPQLLNLFLAYLYQIRGGPHRDSAAN